MHSSLYQKYIKEVFNDYLSPENSILLKLLPNKYSTFIKEKFKFLKVNSSNSKSNFLFAKDLVNIENRVRIINK